MTQLHLSLAYAQRIWLPIPEIIAQQIIAQLIAHLVTVAIKLGQYIV